ncbi:MAG: glycosyltransferase family 1 protein [Clostridiales bacterium]|nr:glycosyltransferase family 1 protein [Clostridiales bacterium]
MRITMICIGSTGDVRPYIVLGRELKRRGHDVKIAAFDTFQEAVEKEGMRFQAVSGDVKEFMASIMKPGVNGVTLLKQVRDTLADIIDPFLADLEAACDDAEAIIATFFGQIVQSIAEVRHVPFIQTHYFPMDRNRATPIASAPGQRAGQAWNKATYPVGYLLISLLEKYYLSDWRKAHGMQPRKLLAKPSYHLNGHVVPVLYAMSPLLMPRPVDWGANIHMTGFWLDDQSAQDYQPDPELQAFLDAGEPPVYIGFGSMVSGDMGETLKIVLDAVARSGVRVVLAKGWGVEETDVAVDMPNVFMTGFVPHDWLFDRVSAVVHHGGAGTTAAGILAGKPTLVIPFGGDQPFWGNRVRMLGVGPKPIPRDHLTARRLSRALTRLVSTKSYQVAAKELGRRLRMEDGDVIAVDMIEHELRKWLRQEGRQPVLVPPPADTTLEG